MALVLYSEFRKSLNNPFLVQFHNIQKTYYSNIYIDNHIAECDAAKWKDQDHYKILSLDHLRYFASPNEVKASYRKKILNYHPDKGLKTTSNDYFTCITKAYELLSDPTKRRSYDSIDPYFDDSLPEYIVPTSSDTKSIYKHFYAIFNPYFELNSRWSISQPVPELKEFDATEDDVNLFYSFWYDFKSWREFSYLDEEDIEKGENRDERRWLLKQNKAQRIKKKKEEVARIRKLVDMAYKNDIRVKNFKDLEKERKKAVKNKREKFKEIESNPDDFISLTPLITVLNGSNTAKVEEKQATTNQIKLSLPIWNDLQIKDLVRATEIFPVGTSSRWDKISLYLNKRYPENLFEEKLIIGKIKELKTIKKPSEKEKCVVWTTEEQKLLEKGIKTVSPKDPIRWEKISQIVTSKSPTDCLTRYQEILSYLKSKKS